MKITAITSIKYEDEALEGQYRSRVDKFVEKLLEKVANGENAGNSLGMHTETWYPDTSAKVDVNIQPGVTSPIIRVRVRRVEEKPTGEEKPKKKKEGTGYIPYLWVGVASYDHVYNDVHYGNPCCWGYQVMGKLYGFEPLQEGDSYTMWHSVEGAEGACYWNILNPWDWYTRFAKMDLGAASDGVGIQERWIPTAFSCGGYEITYDSGQPVGNDHSLFYDECDSLDLTQSHSNLYFLEENAEAYCGNHYSNQHSAKCSKHNLYLLGAVATQLYGPDSAWADVPKHYWQQSTLVDPSGSDVRDDAKNKTFFDHNIGYGFRIRFYDTRIVGPQLKSELLPGYYRFDVAATGFECDPWEAKIRLRMVLGKNGVVPSKDPERLGEVDIATEEVVDIYCEGIGSNIEQTVVNTWNARELFLGGAHPWDFPLNSVDKDPASFGPNPGAPLIKGFWNQSLYVDVQNGEWDIRPFTQIAPFYMDGKGSTFGPCNCTIEEGTIGENSASPVTSLLWLMYYINCTTLTNINGGFAFQLAEVVYRCDGYIQVFMRGDLGRCSGGVPCFAEGIYIDAWQFEVDEDMSRFRQMSASEVNLHPGDIVMVVAVSPQHWKIGVARVYPSWLGMWYSELRCPNSMFWQTFIRHTQDRGRARTTFPIPGECVSDPIYWKYNIAGRGFDIER